MSACLCAARSRLAPAFEPLLDATGSVVLALEIR